MGHGDLDHAGGWGGQASIQGFECFLLYKGAYYVVKRLVGKFQVVAGVNILHYSKKVVGKSFPFLYFWEEFLHFDKYFQTFLRILMKNMNYYVDQMVYAQLLGISLFLAFGKALLDFRNIFTPGWQWWIMFSMFLFHVF